MKNPKHESYFLSFKVTCSVDGYCYFPYCSRCKHRFHESLKALRKMTVKGLSGLDLHHSLNLNNKHRKCFARWSIWHFIWWFKWSKIPCFKLVQLVIAERMTPVFWTFKTFGEFLEVLQMFLLLYFVLNSLHSACGEFVVVLAGFCVVLKSYFLTSNHVSKSIYEHTC